MKARPLLEEKLKTLVVDSMNMAITIAKSLLRGSASLQTLFLEGQYEYLQPYPQEAFVLQNNLFPYLRELRILDCKFEIFPKVFCDCSTIEKLLISCCKQLQALPEWIDSFTSLTQINIFYCPRLENLPYQISRLPKLRFLRIVKCSNLLTEKCQRPTGEYWPFIRHIQYQDIS